LLAIQKPPESFSFPLSHVVRYALKRLAAAFALKIVAIEPQKIGRAMHMPAL